MVRTVVHYSPAPSQPDQPRGRVGTPCILPTVTTPPQSPARPRLLKSGSQGWAWSGLHCLWGSCLRDPHAGTRSGHPLWVGSVTENLWTGLDHTHSDVTRLWALGTNYSR